MRLIGKYIASEDLTISSADVCKPFGSRGHMGDLIGENVGFDQRCRLKKKIEFGEERKENGPDLRIPTTTEFIDGIRHNVDTT